jgi:hypothetical protein
MRTCAQTTPACSCRSTGTRRETQSTTRAQCVGVPGGAVVGWNYLMAISPVGQAAYRARGYAAAKLPLVSASSVPTIKVVVVDRGTHTRRFLNAVSV